MNAFIGKFNRIILFIYIKKQFVINYMHFFLLIAEIMILCLLHLNTNAGLTQEFNKCVILWQTSECTIQCQSTTFRIIIAFTYFFLCFYEELVNCTFLCFSQSFDTGL